MALLLGAAFTAAPQDPTTAFAPREIDIVAKRFTFEPAAIEVTEGERIRLRVSSADGVHGLQVRRLRINKLIPRGGKAVTIDFVAPAPGTYEVLCSEECGDGHDTMTGTLIVKARAK
jgi:cytochrome c oxidase subunit II